MAKPMTASRPAAASLPAPGYTDVVEAFGAEVAQYSRETFESAGQTVRGLIGARTLEDVVQLQTEFAKRSVDGFIARGAKLSELGYALFGAGVEAWTARAKI
jgi:hypothetical protein